MEEETTTNLQKRESEIWQSLQSKCSKKTQKDIWELIDINVELEARSNQ